MWLLWMKKSSVRKYFVDLIRACFFFCVYGENNSFFTFHASFFIFLELVNELLIPLLLGFCLQSYKDQILHLVRAKKIVFLFFLNNQIKHKIACLLLRF
jgi:hypothetical protein